MLNFLSEVKKRKNKLLNGFKNVLKSNIFDYINKEQIKPERRMSQSKIHNEEVLSDIFARLIEAEQKNYINIRPKPINKEPIAIINKNFTKINSSDDSELAQNKLNLKIKRVNKKQKTKLKKKFGAIKYLKETEKNSNYYKALYTTYDDNKKSFSMLNNDTINAFKQFNIMKNKSKESLMSSNKFSFNTNTNDLKGKGSFNYSIKEEIISKRNVNSEEKMHDNLNSYSNLDMEQEKSQQSFIKHIYKTKSILKVPNQTYSNKQNDVKEIEYDNSTLINNNEKFKLESNLASNLNTKFEHIVFENKNLEENTNNIIHINSSSQLDLVSAFQINV